MKTKEAKAEKMLEQMVKCMSDLTKIEIQNVSKETIKYEPKQKIKLPEWC